MERRQPLFEARHPALDHFRILLYQRPNQVQVADGHGRKDVVARPALEQKRQQVVARRIHRCRFVPWRAVESGPTDHVELVHVSIAVCVAPRIEQRAYDLQVPVGGSPVQRASVVS